MSLEDRARELYDLCPTTKPDWDQLGEVTKSVWRKRAAVLAPKVEAPAQDPDAERQWPRQQGTLF